jgi:hypothetical protein
MQPEAHRKLVKLAALHGSQAYSRRCDAMGHRAEIQLRTFGVPLKMRQSKYSEPTQQVGQLFLLGLFRVGRLRNASK